MAVCGNPEACINCGRCARGRAVKDSKRQINSQSSSYSGRNSYSSNKYEVKYG